MLLSLQRDDHAWVRINTDHIIYVYPQGSQPGNPAVLVLSSGDTVKLKDSFTEFCNRPEVKKLSAE